MAVVTILTTANQETFRHTVKKIVPKQIYNNLIEIIVFD